ncbi:hypothetical protein C8Q78DRAFT_1080131 [Trametes maxima]|nr:hypothetical protein C8Q78DRAFT_1080131 [Trametes maxima]
MPEEDRAVFEEIQGECPWYTPHLHSNWRTGHTRKRRRDDTLPPTRAYPTTSHAPDVSISSAVANASQVDPAPAFPAINIARPGQPELFAGSDATFISPPKWMTPNTTIEEVRCRAAADGVSGAVYFQAWEKMWYETHAVATGEPHLPSLAPWAESLIPLAWTQFLEPPSRYFPANIFDA